MTETLGTARLGELGRPLRELKKRLEEALSAAVQMTLFGSHARGEATAESDVDLLVVVPRLDETTMEVVLEKSWEVGFEAGLVFSVIPVGADEVPQLAGSPFLESVKREGIEI